jgi:D-glycero-D-manno-heptose 1,7-bisphosphate phosphatase
MAYQLLADMVVEAFAVHAPPEGSIEICPHAPHDNCPCRKPKPLMLVRMLHRFRTRRDETLFVGDMKRDEEAARRAGVRFLWAHEFFNRKNQMDEDISAA